MAHKVNPKSYRLRDLKDWDSRWFNSKKQIQFLEEDFKIREYLDKKVGKLGVERIEIERFSGKLIIIISSARPGLIIGRGGGGVDDLKKGLIKVLGTSSPKELKVEIREVKDPWSSANLTAQWVAQQLERRIPPRRAIKQAIEKVMAIKTNKGIKINTAGRLGGGEIARREWLKQGRLPRQTIRADIDYAQVNAMCSYGIIGVKVWIYKGDKFDK
ncbi:MAG: 30S ribosomal protein S3 [Candidatus Pacebacteria bacterium]|nr:30S ribosomal protein S3 [Candidatus Paceibacterota bacterium]